MADFVSLYSRQEESAGDKVLKLFADPFQSQVQVKGVWAALGVSLSITVTLTLVFSLLRPRHSLVYAPRSKHTDADHAIPPPGKSLFGWVKPVWMAREDQLFEKLGMDAVVFLRFLRMLRNIFCIMAVIGVAIMIPVNITTGTSSIQDKSNVFRIMTPLYTFGQGLWAQVVVAWFMNAIVIYFMWHNYRRVHSLRRKYFASPEYQGSLAAHSVMLRHIPEKLRSEEGILRITDEVNPTGSLPVPIAIRDVKELPDWIEEHDDAVRKLEAILAKYLKNPNAVSTRRPMMKAPKKWNGPTINGQIDSIDYYRRYIERLEQNINGIRQQIDSEQVMSFGFASWEHIGQAHVVAHAARRKTPHSTKIRIAPRPNDIIWKNLPLTKGQLRRKRITNGFRIALLTVAWTPLNAGLAVFVSNLSNLGSLWPSFQRELERDKTFWSIVQGIAAPALTSLVYLLLPMVFRRLQVRAGDVTKTDRDRHVLRNLFNFFVLNNLLIFSLFSAVWQYITNVIRDSDAGIWQALRNGNFFLTVTTQLCQSISAFWVTWILQRNLGAAIDLAQLWTLFYQWYAKTFLSPTPRERIEWTAPSAFDYSSYYNYFLFYFAVSLCFATLQPIILVCTAFYFVIDSVLKKYLLMYVFVTKTESGGRMWKVLIDRMIFSCILADIIIGIVVKSRNETTMVIAMIPLVVIQLAFKLYCMRTFDPEMDYYTRDAKHASDTVGSEPSAKTVNRAAAKFRHPALDKRLPTPMVPANAKHIVSQIYAGRLGSELETGTPAFTDIPMQPVRQGFEPPQHQAFEAVPEGQQDYAFYKNRSDFGNVGGDRLSRYDMMISRPGTPGSIGTPKVMTPYSSRPNSPGPNVLRKEIGTGPQAHHALKPKHSRYSSLARIDSHDVEEVDLSQPPTREFEQRHLDPNDDRANLLRGAGDIRTPNGEFMSMDQFRTPGTAPFTPGDGGGSYDYFRGHGGLR